MKTICKTHPFSGRTAFSLVVAVTTLAFSSVDSHAAAFTQGNLVVERFGDGVEIQTNTGNVIFFDEITTNGTLVQSIQIPTNGVSALIDEGGSAGASEGGMTLSADGKSLVFPGYEASLPSSSQPVTNFDNTVPRGIGRLDLNGNYTLAVTSGLLTNSAFAGANFRGAATDGTNKFWGTGTYPGAANPVGGVWFFGTSSSASQIFYFTNSAYKTANLRCAGIFNGNLWFSTASSTGLGQGIFEFNGFPTTPPTGPSTQPTRLIATTANDSVYNFSASPDGTVVYYADDGSLNTPFAGIHKFTYVGGIWVSNFIYASSAGIATNACYGLAVDWTKLPVAIYTTTGSGTASNSVLKILDTGVGSTATVIATTGSTNKMFRGLSFTPAASQVFTIAAAPTVTNIGPSIVVTNAGSYLSLIPTGSPGVPIASNFWYEISGSTTNLFATGSSASGAALTFTNLQPGNAGSYFLVLSNASGSVTSSVVTVTVTNSPNILSISPSGSVTNTVGTQITFTLQTDSGFPVASNYWYYISNSIPPTTNLITWGIGSTSTSLTLTNLQLTNAGSYFGVLSNAFGSATSSIVNLGIFIPVPVITGISPTNTVTVGAGATVPFLLSGYQGSPIASNFWYMVTATSTNLVANTYSYTITNASEASIASYYAILTNIYGSATSSIVSLNVTNNLAIVAEPGNVQGLVGGAVQFAVVAGGATPFYYQWYFSDTNGDLISPVSQLGDGSVFTGTNSSVLTLANLQPGDVTNFMVVVTNIYGAVTSSVASILTGTNTSTGGVPSSQAVLALWDFDGPQFVYNPYFPNFVLSPAPFIGNGTASAIGSCYSPGPNFGSPGTNSPGTGSVDAFDVGFDPGQGYVNTPYGFEQPSPNGSWGTENYPATNGVNKANGVQFSVSTLGARNIRVAYDSRTSATASEYERLQYTTNGTAWIDYPASSTFNGVASTYFTYYYSLVGFPGVDNNTNFAVRMVTEWQSTATYQTPATMANTNILGVNGADATNWWVAVANSYTSGAEGNTAAGTVTYDIVAIQGDAITNNNVPPTMSFATLPVTNGLAYTNMVDTNTLTLSFSAGSSQMPATNLTFAVQVLGTQSGAGGPGFPPVYLTPTINPNLVVSNTGSTNFTMTISFTPSTYIPDPLDTAPILITATDTNGESTAAWFDLNVASINQPPTNSLTTLHSTNMLANTSLTIPFTVGSGRDAYTNLTFAVNSQNTTILPLANLVLGGNTNTGQMTLTVTPVANQVGNAPISVTVYDNDQVEPRSTTANIALLVLPNTNDVAVDYFNSGNNGSLDSFPVGGGYWSHVSGVSGQLKVLFGLAIVDSADNTENLQAQLANGPYTTSSGGVLYSSFTVNMNPSEMPVNNGSYFTAFNDGSGTTLDVEDCLVAATNGAAPGYYRLGIGNVVGATANSAQMFPQDLIPGQTYFVITALQLSNGQSTLWVSPTNQVSPSVTDTTTTTLYNISDFELRESGSTAGSISVGDVTVGTTFNSVFYPPVANPLTLGASENATNVLNPLPGDGGYSLSLTNVSETDGNGAVTNTGTNITYVPTVNFTGAASINYSIVDNLGNISNATLTVTVTNVPPLANPVSYNVAENSSGNVFNPLTNCIVETPGGVLSLVSVSETDGNGTPSVSGNQVLFTPTSSFLGTATIGYTITDGLGGTNSSVITVAVGTPSPILLGVQTSGKNIILSWSNTPYIFSLQYSTNVNGPYINLPSATSPYTNSTTTNAASFFRLVH